MTKDEFTKLNDYICGNLKSSNTFAITTSKLFKVIGYDIQFSKGHNKIYNDFIEYCEKYSPTYSFKSRYKSIECDKQFDIEFTLD